MPNYIQLIDKNGKQIDIDVNDFNKAPNKYGSYRVRMRDDEGADYDVPATRLGAMQEYGLHVFCYRVYR